MQKILTVVVIVLSWIVYFLSFGVPRSSRMWIFVGWYKSKDRETFADNSKYLFLHVANTRKDIQAIWMAEDNLMRDILRAHGYTSYNIHSFLGAYYSLRAGYTIIDALMRLANWRYSGRSKTIQLWHADGIKKLELGSAWTLAKWKEILLTPALFKKIHFFIASSPYISEHFISPSFGVATEKIRITGLPRYDAFFSNVTGADIDVNTELEKKLSEIQLQKPEKIIFYGPTFRRGRTASAQLDHLQLPALNDFLKSKNYFLFVSLHPKFSASEWLPEQTFDRIVFVNADYDIYPLLPRFDALVTDYSSTCLEFLLLDKPSIFYVYDFEEYKKNPGIPEEFWGMVPGPRVKTFEELLLALEAPDTLSKERKRVRDILFTFEKGHSAEAVTNSIVREITS